VESVRCWHPKGFAVFSVAVAAAIAVCKSLPILVGIPSLRFPLVWNFMGACVNLIIHFGVKFIFDLAALLVVTGFSSDCWPSGFCFCARKLSAGVN